MVAAEEARGMTRGPGKPPERGMVYFMRRADGVGPIKIGCSRCPNGRLLVYDEWSPEKLAVIATAPGVFADETRLHRQFAGVRLHHEWFEATPELLALVAKVAATGVLPPASPNDKWQRIEAMYRGGRTLKEIGDELGVTRERVRQILRKAGVPSLGWRYGVGKNQSKALGQREQVVALAKQGLPVVDIAREIGSNRGSVLKLLRHEGITPTAGKAGARFKPDTMERAAEIAAEYAAGQRIRDIMSRHGVNATQVYRFLKYMGASPSRLPRRAA